MNLSILREVLSAPTAPYHEEAVAAVLGRWARQLGLPLRHDPHGNILIQAARGRVGTAAHPWTLVAHMDHPGFVSLRQRGRLVWGEFLGNVNPEYFSPGTRVMWHGADGAAGSAIEAATARTPRRTIHVRVRLDAPRHVPPDTLGMWDLPAFAVRGRRVSGRACDDLAGLAMCMCAVEQFLRDGRAGRLHLLAMRAEEEGFIGAIGAIRAGTLGAGATVVSVESSSVAGGPVRQGAGVIIRVGDRASTFDPVVTRTLAQVAADLAGRDKRFHWQRALMAGGTCEATPFAHLGYAAGGVCVPMGNYHNQGPRGRIAPETVHLDDFDAGARLLAELAHTPPDLGAGRLGQRLDELWRHGAPRLRRPIH